MFNENVNLVCEHCEKGGFTYSEQFRHETEVRYFCNIPTLDLRQKFLDGIEVKRGKEAADRLREDVRKFWLLKSNKEV